MAEADIKTPLLTQNQNSPNPSDNQPHLSLSINSSFSDIKPQNPFEFLGVDGFYVPGSTSADPFKNHTPKFEGVYEWIKTVICLPIASLRLALLGFVMVVGFFATLIALLGWKDYHNPMPKWRCRFMWITRFCARGILFSYGFQWIKRKGRPAPREIAPIVVSNHVSFIEPIFFFYELFPTIVASESHDSSPFIGPIIRAMQVIYTDRFSPSSRKNAVNEIKRKASCNRFPRVLLFPEGTTTNGRFLLSFQLGAFIPGYPVQPVVIRYPYVHFDHSWSLVSLGKLMFRMFTQFHNFMEVEYLPVVQPLQTQNENASAFAKRTAQEIATALNVVQTSYSYGDMMLLMRAHELNQENPSKFVVGLAHENLIHRINTMEAVDFLDKFLSMNPDKSGDVKFEDFARALRLKPCGLSEKIFVFVDVENRGKIAFKQFLLASIHVMKQPLFQRALEYSFARCNNGVDNHIYEKKFGDSIGLVMPNINHDDVKELYNMFDMDGDGRISKHDFFDCLRRNPLLIALFTPLLHEEEFCHSRNGLPEEMV